VKLPHAAFFEYSGSARPLCRVTSSVAPANTTAENERHTPDAERDDSGESQLQMDDAVPRCGDDATNSHRDRVTATVR
jgi:hypothetical protein